MTTTTRKMRKTVGKPVALLCAAALAATACSTGNQEGGPAAAPQPAKNDKPVEITVFYNSGKPVEDFNARWGNKIKQKFPNYKLNYITKDKSTTLIDYISAGNKLDLYIDSIGAIATGNGLFDLNMQYDMSELVKKHSLDLNRFEPSTIASIQNFGGLYGIPIHTSTLVLYYNKDIFNKFGVPFLKDGMTWDEVLEVAGKLTVNDNGTQYLGFATSPAHLFRMNQLSAPTVDPKTSQAAIETDKWKQMIQTAILNPASNASYKKWVQTSGKIPPADMFLKDQTLGMYLYFIDWLPDPAQFGKMNWDIVSAPTYKDMPKIGLQTYPTYFSITSTSEHKDETMELIKYVTSDEFQLDLSKQGFSLPVLKSDAVRQAFAKESSFKGRNDQAVFYNTFAAPSVKTMYDSAVEGQVNKLLPKVIDGSMDLNTALRTAAEAANKSIDGMKKK